MESVETIMNDPGFKTALGDIFTLAGRVKQDSDELRKFILRKQGVTFKNAKPFESNWSQADFLRSPQASPASHLHIVSEKIDQQLQFLNYHLNVLSRSMGSTMGRFGSMIP